MIYFDTSPRNITKYIVVGLLALVAIALLTACRTTTEQIPVECPNIHLEVKEEKAERNVLVHFTDTIIYTINANGDTCKNEKHKERIYIEVHDTIKENKIDTITKPIYLTKTIYKKHIDKSIN